MKLLRGLLVVPMMMALSTAALAQKGTVTCKDGTKSAGGRGACSSHGGIAAAATKAEAKVAAAEKKVEAKAAKTEAKAAKTEAKAEKKAAANAAKGEETVAAGAIAECKDHTYSHAKTHQGACSRHGGVARFLDAKK